MHFPSPKGVQYYADEQLHHLVALFMRDDVALLWVQGSCSLTYWFFWTCESTAGWHASTEELDHAEQEESSSWLRTCDNPLLWALDNGCKRKVRKRDCFFEGTPVRILRVALGVVKEEEQKME